MSKITSEQAIGNIIFHTFGDVDKIKTLEKSLSRNDEQPLSEQGKEFLSKINIDEDFFNSPQYKSIKEAQRREDEKKLKKLQTCGSHTDALQPILILLGNTTMIKEKVIEPVKLEIIEKKGWNIEFREIDSYQFTKGFVDSLPDISDKDGGVIIVYNLSRFIHYYDINSQNEILRNLMVNPKEKTRIDNLIVSTSTGWRIIFIEDTEDENKWWPDSCMQYFGNKNCLYSYFVE